MAEFNHSRIETDLKNKYFIFLKMKTPISVVLVVFLCFSAIEVVESQAVMKEKFI